MDPAQQYHLIHHPLFQEPTRMELDFSKISFDAKVLKDSIVTCSPNLYRGKIIYPRITTMLLTYPRCIHSEFMTHRVFSRNAASSRAIPAQKMVATVMEHPFIPIHWGQNQKGMQARNAIEDAAQREAAVAWLRARDHAADEALRLIDLGLHKQIVNRLLEPWAWISVVCTSTNWSNFFALRCHPDAEPHMQKLAYMMRDAYNASTPEDLDRDEWHIPFVEDPKQIVVPLSSDDMQRCDQFNIPLTTIGALKVATGRCARLSYLTFDGDFSPEKDAKLHDDLAASGHWSPFEHCARYSPSAAAYYPSNLTRFLQYRKCFLGECK